MRTTLFHIHDPMCSWCWAFKPSWEKIRAGLGDIVHQNVVGGLAPDSSQPMPEEMRARLEGTWRQIQQTVPGTEFNFDFWQIGKPRRSTYPACRAVLCAAAQNSALEEPMITAIQRAYYLEARNPSDNHVLISLAGDIGCDTVEFAKQLESTEIEETLQQEFNLVRQMGVRGFPSLVLLAGDQLHGIQVDYNSAITSLDMINAITKQQLSQQA